MNACEMLKDPSKSVLQMLKNACECRCESYECVVNETQMLNMGYLICIIHIAGVSLCLISARPCTISLFSFEFGLIFHICPAFCGNVNMNADESLQISYIHLQTFYDHYKCLAINKNCL